MPTSNQHVIGGSVDDNNGTINGFVFDYIADAKIVGICLWESTELPFIDILYYEEQVDYCVDFEKMMATNPDCRERWVEIINRKQPLDFRSDYGKIGNNEQ